MLEKIKQSFTLDLRSLSAFRIALGLVTIYRYILALRWAPEMLSPEGFLPVQVTNNWHTKWSLFYISNTTTWAEILCLSGVIIGIMLVLGIRTKIILPILWLLTASLSNRLTFIENAGNGVYRLMLIWSIFLPLDSFFVLHKKNEPSLIKNKFYFGIPSVAFYLQFFAIYFVAGFMKNDHTWHGDFSAVYSALHLGAFVKPLGQIIAQHEELTKYLTMSTVVMEIACAFFLFYEGKLLKLRSFAVLFFFTLQIGFFLCLEVGIFPFAMTTFAIAFIPSSWWDKIIKYRVDLEESHLKYQQKNFSKLILIALIIIASLDGISSTSKQKLFKNPAFMTEATYLFRVDQRWWMFVVSEWRDFWFSVEGLKKDGSVIDPWSWYRGKSDLNFSTNRPEDIRELFSEQPWNNYFHQIKLNKPLTEWFMFNLCEAYNIKNKENPLVNLKLHYSYYRIQGFNSFSPTQHEIISEWNCKKVSQ